MPYAILQAASALFAPIFRSLLHFACIAQQLLMTHDKTIKPTQQVSLTFTNTQVPPYAAVSESQVSFKFHNKRYHAHD